MDRIEKKALLRAPLARVWQAVSDAAQFGSWFGARFSGPFAAGTRLSASISPTTVDPEVAKLQKPHEGMAFDFWVECVEPMRYISFRWHPYAIEPGIDYSDEPTTLIEFTLEPSDGGTLLTIVESGFENIPLARRAAAFRANEGGWAHQMRMVAGYLTR